MSTFEEILERDGSLIYKTCGTSMEPLIREGRDVLLIKKADGRLKKYDVPLYRRDDGAYVLHRIIKVCDGYYVVRGDNLYYKEIVEDEKIVGVLAAMDRGGREVNVTDFSYRLRSRIRCATFPVRRVLRKLMSRSLS